MPFYVFDRNTQGGNILGEGLDYLRLARYKLAHVKGVLNQQTNQQIADFFGFADATVAGNAKAEIDADIGKFLNRDTGVNAAQVDDALVQMLNQFG